MSCWLVCDYSSEEEKKAMLETLHHSLRTALTTPHPAITMETILTLTKLLCSLLSTHMAQALRAVSMLLVSATNWSHSQHASLLKTVRECVDVAGLLPVLTGLPPAKLTSAMSEHHHLLYHLTILYHVK